MLRSVLSLWHTVLQSSPCRSACVNTGPSCSTWGLVQLVILLQSPSFEQDVQLAFLISSLSYFLLSSFFLCASMQIPWDQFKLLARSHFVPWISLAEAVRELVFSGECAEVFASLSLAVCRSWSELYGCWMWGFHWMKSLTFALRLWEINFSLVGNLTVIRVVLYIDILVPSSLISFAVYCLKRVWTLEWALSDYALVSLVCKCWSEMDGGVPCHACFLLCVDCLAVGSLRTARLQSNEFYAKVISWSWRRYGLSLNAVFCSVLAGLDQGVSKAFHNDASPRAFRVAAPCILFSLSLFSLLGFIWGVVCLFWLLLLKCTWTCQQLPVCRPPLSVSVQ